MMLAYLLCVSPGGHYGRRAAVRRQHAPMAGLFSLHS